MKYLKILFLFATLLLAVFLILIFTSESETQINLESTTEIPQPVVFKQTVMHLLNQPYLTELPDTAVISVTYSIQRHPFKVNYRLQIDASQYRIEFLPPSKKNALQPFKAIRQSIRLKKLVDGTTGIQWQMRYRITGLTPRLLNRFFWKPELKNDLQKEMQQLRRFLSS